ncbi:hypothetical protein DICPUDRAFT_91210 [Dictyostelium purpureum]|uniref:Follistatin-like domain-containing protein n=1 Tax=Dictyostelium purpureum TaxID=5786 RepID=F0Z937_DICPU|nr:uncharacterized protein DICPUDRAFT_91210 [Dictyostelium purpureum]EGC39596.1 hypothetical protein DICPUDRAFT_91210 [Dictyostelium purpureum]|eukprot:XP_003283931.1 hypothetical protein DICPUDRAFT_91210 [Dictyostelium purpureum]
MRIVKSLILFIYSLYIIASVSAYESNNNNGGWGSLWEKENDGWGKGGGGQVGWEGNHHGNPHGNPHHGDWNPHHKKPEHEHKPIIKDPCYNQYCPRGWQCKAENGKASCVEVVESCENVHCPRRHHCEIIGKRAKCVSDPHKPEDCDACRDLICPDNYRCLPKPEGGWFKHHIKHHWQLHPSHCGNNPNRVKAICVKSPIGDCSKVRCPRGYKCKLYENGPSCERIKRPHCLTCKEMHCEQNGLVCVLTPVSKHRLFLDPECCPIVPTCISPNTIAASTIATTASAHGTTIASLVTTGPNSIGGGTGGIDFSSSEVSSSSEVITTTGFSSSDDSSNGITTDFLDTGDITDFITDIGTGFSSSDEGLTTEVADTGDITDFITDFVTGFLSSDEGLTTEVADT